MNKLLSSFVAACAVWTIALLWQVSALGAATASVRRQDPVPAEAVQPGEPIPSQLTEDELHKLFPDGPGRDEIFNRCTRCHPVEKVATKHLVADEWERLLTAMVTRGAQLPDDEFGVVLEYLTANLPLVVNVNTATAEELATGFGLKMADATNIVQYREKNGPFKTLDDLKKIPDIEFKRIQLNKGAIKF